ncbi:MAG TPA: MFS transporter [Solirubrobacteraceae bacterium]|nr:MFS transporter [Solirubrobacteraceae bacterium]
MRALDEASRKRWTLALCCLSQFMVILDVSIVNVALPSIRRDLGFTETNLQWVVNAYTLTFAGFLLLGGRAADLLGRRRVFVFGLVLFAGASLAGGLSNSQEMLVIARGAQGLGGAVVAPATLSILTTTFTEGHERNRALSFWGAMGGAGGAAGALLGGILTDLLSWQWILFINVPIGIAAAAAALRVVGESHAPPNVERRYDVAGAVTVTAGLVVLVYGIVRTDVEGWGSSTTLITLAVGAVLLAMFVAIEARLARRPLVPLRIFGSRTLTGANVVVFLLGASAFAMWFFVSLYLQQVLGYSPLEAGIAFLPMTAMIVIGSTMAGRLTARVGAGPLLVVGMTLFGAGMLLFAQISPNGSYLGDILAPSLLTAIGMGLAFVPVTIAAMAGVQRAESGLASGLVNTSRQFGGSLGLAILATLAGERSQHLLSAHASVHTALTDGYQRGFVVGAAFAFASALAAAFLVPRVRPGQQAAAAPAAAEA